MNKIVQQFPQILAKVNSNSGAVQDVAQPDAQLADQYFAQPESSP